MKRHWPSKQVPFHHYSSKNKKGGRPHPVVYLRRDKALTMFWEHRTIDEIATELNLPVETIRSYIKHGRKNGDERAMRRTGLKRIIQAQVRRRQIAQLHAAGLSPAEIASQLGCHTRLVQLRLKEASVVDVIT